MELTAVLWSSDLRGFTERSDRLPSERMIAILNALCEAQAAEIRGHGGEILKFIGDGLLAIFPIAEADAVAAIAKAGVAAARNATDAVADLARHLEMCDDPPLTLSSHCMSARSITAISVLSIGSISRSSATRSIW
jgi:adenylate cyclase